MKRGLAAGRITTAILLVAALLLAVALMLVAAYALGGSQEMFPTPEREEAVRLAGAAVGASIALLEIAVLWLLWRRWR